MCFDSIIQRMSNAIFQMLGEGIWVRTSQMERYRAGQGSNDAQGTLHELVARPAGRDGRPVPYEGVRYCVVVSTEYVGEAFRLPRGGTQAAPYGGVRSCADVSVEYVGEAFRLPLGVRTSQMERYRAAKVVTTRRAPCTKSPSAPPTRAAKVVTMRMVPCTHWKPALRAGTGDPSPTVMIDGVVLYRENS